MPTGVVVLEKRHTQYVLYTQVAAEAGIVLHVLNTYIPPTSSDPEHVIWD